MDPAEALDAIAEILETALEPTYRIKAFRTAADAARNAGPKKIAALAAEGKLKDLPGVGDKTALVISQALTGAKPDYLARLEGKQPNIAPGVGASLRVLLKGDLHLHSDWNDGPPKYLFELAKRAA